MDTLHFPLLLPTAVACSQWFVNQNDARKVSSFRRVSNFVPTVRGLRNERSHHAAWRDRGVDSRAAGQPRVRRASHRVALATIRKGGYRWDATRARLTIRGVISPWSGLGDQQHRFNQISRSRDRICTGISVSKAVDCGRVPDHGVHPVKGLKCSNHSNRSSRLLI